MEYEIHYDTFVSIGIYSYVCAEAQSTCDVLRKYFQAQTQLRTYNNRHSHDALISLMQSLRGADFCSDTLITYTHSQATLHSQTRRNYNCTMGK